jgi:murein DD-endopeptidase MepM/ murein hydrolase activator NlpD
MKNHYRPKASCLAFGYFVLGYLVLSAVFLFALSTGPAMAAQAMAAQATATTPRAVQLNPNWVYPSSETIVSRPFEPPAQNWLAGHRGVDFRGEIGQEVFATGTGTVVFADQLAGKGVVVISHGLIRTTYEPVTAEVKVGELVNVGQLIGHLTPGVSHCATTETVWCLHWGAIRNGKYLNPLLLLYPRVRLLPLK